MKTASLPYMLLLLLSQFSGYSQNFGEENRREVSQFKDIFTGAQVQGHFRNYFMNTINTGMLKDYYTNATGGAVKIVTKNFKGFEVGAKASFTYETFGADLDMEDPVLGKASKWEYELYDVLDKGNVNGLPRLEELYMRYSFGSSYLSYGRLETEYTPLLNSSDGRMKPFVHQGAWGHFNLHPRHLLNVGWLSGVSPRSTTEWLGLEEAIGLFNNGFQPNGTEARYQGNYPSKGLAVLNYNYSSNKFNLHVYDFYLDKVHNTVWMEMDYELSNFNLGMQYVFQSPLRFSEKLSYQNRYLQPHEKARVISSQLGWKNGNFHVALAYTHAFDTGRFLFPKELGRDQFFTSMSRSRLEGLGNVNVYKLQAGFLIPSPELHLGVEFQELKGPQSGNTNFNRYNLDESFQVNTRATYSVSGFMEGLSFDLLWVYRKNRNHTDAANSFNKSNYNQFNFVTNFYF